MRRRLSVPLAAALLAGSLWLSPVAAAADAPGTIDTYVGDRIASPCCSGALLAVAHQPFAVTAGRSAIFIADPVHRIGRVIDVDTEGPLSEDILAGNLALATGVDGTDARAAQLAGPYAIAEDAVNGDVYIADTYGHQVRKILGPTAGLGAISTIAGTGDFGFAGDSVVGKAADAKLNSPYGIAVFHPRTGATIVYVADTLNNRVRAIVNGTITTVVGGGSPTELDHPRGLAVDGTGRLYIADTFHHRVVRFSPSLDATTGTITGGVVEPVAGTGARGRTGDGGTATAAKLDSPAAVALGRAGALYIADTGNNVIRRVDGGGTIATVVGTGTRGFNGNDRPPLATDLSSPFGIAVATRAIETKLTDEGLPPPGPDQDMLLIADTGNNLLRVLADHPTTASAPPSGPATIQILAGNGTPGLATVTERLGDPGQVPVDMALDTPTAVVEEVTGRELARYVLDTFNHSVRVMTVSRRIDANTFIGSGLPGPATATGTLRPGGGQLHLPLGIAAGTNAAGETVIYIADTFNNVVRAIVEHANGTRTITTVAGTGAAGFGGDGGAATSARLSFPTGLAVDGQDLFIADTYNARIRRVDGATGRISTVAGTGQLGPEGDGGQATDAHLNFPYGVAVGEGSLFIADSFDNRVRRVDGASGVITTVAGGAGGPALDRPWGLAFTHPTGASPTLYISDFGNHVVRQLDITTGALTVLAGTPGQRGFAGDPGDPTRARLDAPRGVALGSIPVFEGPSLTEILIADSFTNRIRIIGAPVYAAGASAPFPPPPASEPPCFADSASLTVDFGRTDRNTPVDKNLCVANLGSGIMSIECVSTAAPGTPCPGSEESNGFFVVDFCDGAKLVHGGTCRVFVDFRSAGAGGPQTATLIVRDNATGAPHRIVLTGFGLVPRLGATPDIDFGTASISGGSATTVETLTNTGDAVLNVQSVSVTGDGSFARVAPPAGGTACSFGSFTLAPGTACDVAVRFTPGSLGPHSGTLAIVHNGFDGPTRDVALSGVGGIGQLQQIFPVTFASVLVGGTSTIIQSLRNVGNAPLTVGGIAVTGTDFSKDTIPFPNNCPATPFTLAPGAECSFLLVFQPTAAVTRTGTLSVTHNGTGSPTTATLTGSGISPPTPPPPG